ncbi:MAG: GntR family transcriptional regulator [Nitrososphaerales archaeon]
MDIERVDTKHAYGLIRTRITTLELAPGALINAQQLAAELNLPLFAVEEALKLLAHDHLVRITLRHGTYVADVNIADLEQLSELRIELESLAAALAAQRATADDLAVLEALREAQVPHDAADARTLFDLDHRFHQAIAQAAKNIYLAETLEQFYGMSLRLWYLVLPRLQFLPGSVEKHLALVDAIRRKQPAVAEQIARAHVREFYVEVREVLAAASSEAASRAAGRREP